MNRIISESTASVYTRFPFVQSAAFGASMPDFCRKSK